VSSSSQGHAFTSKRAVPRPSPPHLSLLLYYIVYRRGFFLPRIPFLFPPGKRGPHPTSRTEDKSPVFSGAFFFPQTHHPITSPPQQIRVPVMSLPTDVRQNHSTLLPFTSYLFGKGSFSWLSSGFCPGVDFGTFSTLRVGKSLGCFSCLLQQVLHSEDLHLERALQTSPPFEVELFFFPDHSVPSPSNSPFPLYKIV